MIITLFEGHPEPKLMRKREREPGQDPGQSIADLRTIRATSTRKQESVFSAAHRTSKGAEERPVGPALQT